MLTKGEHKKQINAIVRLVEALSNASNVGLGVRSEAGRLVIDNSEMTELNDPRLIATTIPINPVSLLGS